MLPDLLSAFSLLYIQFFQFTCIYLHFLHFLFYYNTNLYQRLLILFANVHVCGVLIQYLLQGVGRGLWSDMLLVDWACM